MKEEEKNLNQFTFREYSELTESLGCAEHNFLTRMFFVVVVVFVGVFFFLFLF
jgi:hypothetical protein